VNAGPIRFVTVEDFREVAETRLSGASYVTQPANLHMQVRFMTGS
jgi:hypothetical protein